MAPFDFFFSLAILMLHWSTLSEAAFSQDGHSESWLGMAWVSVHASNRAVLLSSSFRRVMSK